MHGLNLLGDLLLLIAVAIPVVAAAQRVQDAHADALRRLGE